MTQYAMTVRHLFRVGMPIGMALSFALALEGLTMIAAAGLWLAHAAATDTTRSSQIFAAVRGNVAERERATLRTDDAFTSAPPL
jgi:hypothetical protein